MNENIQKRLLQAVAGLFIILFFGTIGYWSITGYKYDIFYCLYMTVITVTTIGYDEKFGAADFTDARPFTILLAFTGIGLLTYCISSITAIIIEGHIRESFKKRKMEREIDNLKLHYIICGISKHSFHLIEELVSTARECVIIDLNSEVIAQVLKKYPSAKYIVGDASNDETLTRAGVKKAKGLFASTNNDNLNLVICLSARRLNGNLKIVSLCINHDNIAKIKMAGADTVVSPNFIGGLRMASEMLRPTVTDFLDSMLRDKNKNLRLEQIDFNSKFEGKHFSEIDISDFKDTLPIAVKSNDEWIYKPGDNYELKSGDSLIVLTTPQEREKLEDMYS